MASNVTPPPAQSAPSGEGASLNPALVEQLLEELDGKVTVAKVRDALVKLLQALS